MPTLTFKVSDSQKYSYLWALLNVNCTEENNWAVEYGICDIYDEYAIVRNYAEAKFERIYYTKNDEADSLEITNREDCYIVDVNENEKNALKNLHSKNNDTYENLDSNFVSAESLAEVTSQLETANNTILELNNSVNTLTEQNSEFSTKIEELSGEKATLIQEKDEAIALHTAVSEQITSIQATLDSTNATLATVTTERDTLAAFKKNIEDEKRTTLINGYADQLPEEIIDSYTKDMDNYSLVDLDMKLTYELKINHPEIFSKGTPPAYIPKDSGSEGGINAILAKYKK